MCVHLSMFCFRTARFRPQKKKKRVDKINNVVSFSQQDKLSKLLFEMKNADNNDQ